MPTADTRDGEKQCKWQVTSLFSAAYVHGETKVIKARLASQTKGLAAITGAWVPWANEHGDARQEHETEMPFLSRGQA